MSGISISTPGWDSGIRSPAAARAAGITLPVPPPSGRILQVGPTRPFRVPSQAEAVSGDGDTIEIDAGCYPGDVVVWRRNGLRIRGMHGPSGPRAHMQAAGNSAESKAIWVIRGADTEVGAIEFSGCAVPNRNGAGIRQEGPGLTLRDCSFHDNENGVLTGRDPRSDIVFERCEFARNGSGDGYSHNMYIGHARSFTMEACYTHGSKVGHLVKSRAAINRLLYNRITCEDGSTSYPVDLPNGGCCLLVGNLIELGPRAENEILVTIGEEGPTNPGQAVHLVANTLVQNRPGGGTFVRVVGTPSRCQLNGNLLIGPGTALEGQGEQVNDRRADAMAVTDLMAYDYHPRPGSKAVGGTVIPGRAEGFDLTPVFQYRHPLMLEPRKPDGGSAFGAYGPV